MKIIHGCVDCVEIFCASFCSVCPAADVTIKMCEVITNYINMIALHNYTINGQIQEMWIHVLNIYFYMFHGPRLLLSISVFYCSHTVPAHIVTDCTSLFCLSLGHHSWSRN